MAIRELDLEKDLNNYLEQATDVKAPFEIKDDKAADWALRKIREAEARIEQVQRFADERKAEIDAWLEPLQREKPTRLRFHRAPQTYHFKLHQANPRIKTIKLPAGELQLRKRSPNTAGMITS